MKKQLHFFSVILLFLIFSTTGNSQNSDGSYQTFNNNPLHIGLKIGIPNGVGLGAEWVTPLLGNRIAPYVDFSYIPTGDVEGSYLEVGSNIYFGNKGKGLYLGLGYGKADVEVSNLDGETDDGDPYENGVAKEEISTFNIKLGTRTGGRFYFRSEIGYGFGSIPDDIYVTADINGIEQTFPLGYDDVFELFSGTGIPLFNLGFGYSF